MSSRTTAVVKDFVALYLLRYGEEGYLTTFSESRLCSVGKDLEGNGRGLIEIIFQNLAGGPEETTVKPWSRLETCTSPVEVESSIRGLKQIGF
jgi:hypothetical protein